MQPHILVLGANGQLGSDIVSLCQKQNIEFTSVTQDDFDAVTDDPSILFPSGHKISHVVNCIAVTNVDSCESNPDLAFTINAVFVYKLAVICAGSGIKLFHISTDYVFDGNNKNAYTEVDIPNPLNIYGLSKCAGDMAVTRYAHQSFIFRVSSLFGKAGASGKGGNFITTMQRLGSERDTLAVIANQITCPTATLDVARVIIHFILYNIEDYGLYNCASSTSCSWYEFAYEIFKLSGLDTAKLLQADFATYNFIAQRPQYGVLSTIKLNKYYAMPSWQDSLREYFKV